MVVYILYSASADKYYTGFTTEPLAIRIERHNSGYYEDKFTSVGVPWILYHQIGCESVEQARAIEKHIKAMKSRKYIENLKKYPGIEERLKARYAV